MLNLKYPSGNSKTGPIATSYRRGRYDLLGTCPLCCSFRGDCYCQAPRCRLPWERSLIEDSLLLDFIRLLPYGTYFRGHIGGDIMKDGTSHDIVDRRYLRDFRRAVPRGGEAWSYTHCHPTRFRPSRPGELVLNVSCETFAQAMKARDLGHPVVLVRTINEPYHDDYVRVVPCPAECGPMQCIGCGGSRGPLCARHPRDYVVGFGPKAWRKKYIEKTLARTQ